MATIKQVFKRVNKLDPITCTTLTDGTVRAYFDVNYELPDDPIYRVITKRKFRKCVQYDIEVVE